MNLYGLSVVILYLSFFLLSPSVVRITHCCGLSAISGSQRSLVNQCGCYCEISFLGFSLLMKFISLQLALFFMLQFIVLCYSEQMGNSSLHVHQRIIHKSQRLTRLSTGHNRVDHECIIQCVV